MVPHGDIGENGRPYSRMKRTSDSEKRWYTVLSAGAFQLTALTSPVFGSVTANGALPPFAFMPP